MKKSLTYLTAPCSYKNLSGDLFKHLNRCKVHFVQKGVLTVSLAVEAYSMECYGHSENSGWDFWNPLGQSYMAQCNQMYLLALEGWNGALELREELNWAKRLEISIYLVDPLSFKTSLLWYPPPSMGCVVKEPSCSVCDQQENDHLTPTYNNQLVTIDKELAEWVRARNKMQQIEAALKPKKSKVNFW